QVREPLGGGVELLVAEGALAAAVARGAVGAGVLRRLPRLLGGGRGGPGLRGQLVAAGAGRGSPQEGDGPRAGGGAPQNAAHRRRHACSPPRSPRRRPAPAWHIPVRRGHRRRERAVATRIGCAPRPSAPFIAQERQVSTESTPGTAAPATIRLRHLKQAKEQGRPFSMLTAYDQFAAQAFEAAGIEVLLVGDSVGTTVLGYDSTT